MKLLARILSHGFAIAVVMLLAIGLIYRGELFPEYDLPDFLDIGKLADHQKEPTTGRVDRDVVEAQPETPAAATADEQHQAEGRDTITDSTGTGTVEGIAATDVEEPEAEETLQEPPTETEAPSVLTEEVAEEPAIDAVAPIPGETGQQPGEEMPEVDVPPLGESTAATETDLSEAEVIHEDVPESIEPAAPSPQSDTAIIPGDIAAEKPVSRPQEKAYQLLADAREAYWLRDYDTAESKYLALTRLEPDNPDGYGELGNMYFSRGKWDQAATAYYAAGVRLIGQGLLTQAEELIAVIRGLNGANADDLEQKIAAARSAANQ
jgi:hypothetical protein